MIRAIPAALLAALEAIARHRVRAALTILGILLGIAAVVVVTAAGESAEAAIGGEIDNLAADALFVFPQPVQLSGANGKVAGRLTEADGKAISDSAASVANVAPWLSTKGQLIYGDKNWATTLVGTTRACMPIRHLSVASGGMWSETDEVGKTRVCLIGLTVARSLFGIDDPIGRTIRIGRSPFTIIGTIAPRGTSLVGEDQDDWVMVPIGSFRARVMHTAPGRADHLIVGATGSQTMRRAKLEIESILRERHRGEPGRDDFTVTSQAEIGETTRSVLGIVSSILFAIAATSLLVGGIGVMNIMLVSVSERTHEIGVRLAIGARESDITSQFLLEAIVMSMIGGLLGVIVGSAFTTAVGWWFGWKMAPSLDAIGLAVATSIAVGTLFGLLPALRAARLDPIAALRSE